MEIIETGISFHCLAFIVRISGAILLSKTIKCQWENLCVFYTMCTLFDVKLSTDCRI